MKQVDRISVLQTFIAKRSHTYIHRTQFSHMNTDADDHMHTPIYMHSLGFSHANLSVHHKVKTVSTLKQNRPVDGGTKPVPLPPRGWMVPGLDGSKYCCMYTISQLGEGELAIAAGTLTVKGESD